MLDQTKLPFETVYQECKDYQTVARGIKELWVRGAPLTYGTIDQNETTSSGSAPVPAFANTIGESSGAL